MKSKSVFVIPVVMCIVQLNAFRIDGPGNSGSQSYEQRDVGAFFSAGDINDVGGRVVSNPRYLLQAAKDTLAYVNRRDENEEVVNPKPFKNLLSYNDVRQTLQFIISTIQSDLDADRPQRILDTKFLKKHFACLEWSADWKSAAKQAISMPHDGKIRLTSYGIFVVKGGYKKSAAYPCGLYALLDDRISKKYTKQQVLAGALEQPANRSKRRALAWVCRQDLEDALMHGTVLVMMPNGSCKVLNVDKHNGIAYDRRLKNVLAQKRYWFFREIRGKSAQGAAIIKRFKQRQNVIFAGDLDHIGIGKVVALTYKNPLTKKQEVRIGILADTGGAFKNNLYQLDLFGGIFQNKRELKVHLQKLPAATQAHVLYVRQ